METMYRYKLVLSNNKEYYIQSPIGNVTEFAKTVFKLNEVNSFLLSEPYTDENKYRVDTVMIKLDNIISIEYSTN